MSRSGGFQKYFTARHPGLMLALLAGCGIVASGLPVGQVIGWQADDATLTAEKVRDSIDRGINFLKREQAANGTWRTSGYHRGGVTALVTLAMLNAGVPADDLTIKQSLQYLDSLDLDVSTIYTVSLMTMVYAQAGPETRRARIRQCVEHLTAGQYRGGGGVRGRGEHWEGGWTYRMRESRPSGSRPDGSNSQFALLALHEAALIGIEVEPVIWERARKYWSNLRDRNSGGYSYMRSRETGGPTGSMTCAAISSLIIIDENLPRPVQLKDGRIRCCGDEDRLIEVEGASEWLGKRFAITRNPSQDNSRTFARDFLYYMYGMERAARLSGQRFFGAHDWYREGAELLLRTQKTNGSWQGTSMHGESNPDVATPFALLFLSKGKRPVVIGKYRHSEGNDWDRHRKGVHYLTRQLEADWNTKLNWQTIEGRYASSDDLLETPVLYISGRDMLRMGDAQKAALREYVEYGGFIFAEANQGDGCGENVPFEQDFRDLMFELFPDSQLQLLDDNHPIFNAQYDIIPNPNRPLYGLQSSCRTSVIFCPRNLACFWKHNRPASLEQLPDGPKREVEYAIKLGANVVAYATGQEVRDKLDRPQRLSGNEMGLGPRTVLIPKLSHSGGSNDAPNAWYNIIRRAQFDLGERFRFDRLIIDPDIEQLREFPMVFMHGRSPFVWSVTQREALREFLTTRRGFLFADSICSANGFAESFRAEIKFILPEYNLQVIPANDPIWTGENGGYALAQVSMHGPAVGGGIQRYKSPPQLEGINIDGRWAVVFSPHDLSCAMENASPAQCPGYDKDDAARIGVNVILYGLKN